jgi:eukaryotic-like serine/threonine-protein kinase
MSTARQPSKTTVLATESGPAEHASAGASFGVTLADLMRNYRAIFEANAIYYPVSYQFIRELGRGQQGIVMLGVRHGARGCATEHAIKVFTPGLYQTPNQYWTDMGRIARQIARLHSVQNSSLVSRHSYEETQGIGYVEMEAIDGLDLRRLLTPDHLDMARKRSTDDEWQRFTRTIFRLENDRLTIQPGIAIYIIRSILRGLEVLHECNFLHADIKPANVMINRQGYAKIVDFGRAVVPETQQTVLFGSPMYMAPEAHRREPAKTQSDLYSVGLVALEMLRGEPLTPDNRVREAELLAVKEELPSKLRDLLPPYVLENGDLVEILHRLISIDPESRYASARDAEGGSGGLRVIDRQLVQAGLDSEYARDLADYMAKLVNPVTDRVEA